MAPNKKAEVRTNSAKKVRGGEAAYWLPVQDLAQ